MDAAATAGTDAGTMRYRRPSPIAARSSSSLSSEASSDSAVASPTGVDPSLYPGRSRSLAGIALRAFCLGVAVVVGVVLGVLLALLPAVVPRLATTGTTASASGTMAGPAAAAYLAPLWRLPFFLAALATFHFLEFYTTARYNTPAAAVGSFLLTANWPAYAIAHAAGSTECLLRLTAGRWLFGSVSPSWWLWPSRVLLALGFALVLVGQAVRTAAMAHAGRSFNHTIQQQRAQSHALVTSGIYAWLRHPSYFGFFWWALGTQLVLGNVVCLAAYAVVLWRFFSQRVRHEEALLVRFFGDEYVAYRQRVGTKLPFIGG